MKEVYFPPDQAKPAGRELGEEAFPHGQKRAQDFHPGQAGLLLLDLQEYFLDPESHAFVPSAPALLAGLRRLKEVFQARERPVYVTQHLNTEADAGLMAVWWRDLLTPDHPHHALIPGIGQDGDQVLRKSQYDAFYGTNLAERLAADQVQQLVVGGVMSHLCCETTARSAFMRGWEVFFLVDGTATTQRSLHLGTLRALGHGFATLVTVQEIEAEFRGLA